MSTASAKRSGEGRSTSKKARAALLGLAAMALLVLLSPSAASASEILAFKETFGSAAQPTFSAQSIWALAVDQSNGDVLIMDGSKETLSRFKPNGEPDPFSALGTNMIDGKKGPGGKACAEEPSSCDKTPQNTVGSAESADEMQVAVAPPGAAGGTAGDIYVTDPNHGKIQIFASDGHFLGQLSKAGTVGFGETCGVAVDSAGTVYVGEFGGTVHKFVPSANPPLNTNNTANFSTVPHPCVLSAGSGPSAGSLFVVEYINGSLSDPDKGKVFKLSAETGALAYKFGTGVSKVSVEPTSGHILVVGSEFREYDASGAEATVVHSLGAGHNGVAADGASGDIYLSLTHFPIADDVGVYAPAIAPDAETDPAGGVGTTAATLNGAVNPDGVEVTECKFEYGTSTSYGSTAPCSGPIPTDKSNHPVSAAIGSLSPATTYHFRVVATNADGRTGKGEDLTFTTKSTLLSATTTPATAIGGAKATLNGVVAPAGDTVTECVFEYGPTTAYGQSAPCVGATPADEAEHPVSANLTHLTPQGATYHFRIRVTGAGTGVVKGADRSFTTKDTVITGAASAIGVGGATLGGSVNPEGIEYEECRFEYTTQASFEAEGFGGAEAAACAESIAEIGSGESPVSVHASVTGLQRGSDYRYRLTARNVDGTARGKDQGLETFGPPLIEAEWAASVVLGEASLVAQIDPEGFPATYHIEYGTTTAYGHATTEAPAGSGKAGHALTSFLEGLAPETTYHWRAVAISHCNPAEAAEVCIAEGPDRTFTTYGASSPDTECPNQALRIGPSANLPDCRAYEMVTPVDKNGGDGWWEGLSQSSIDGDGLTYTSKTPFGGALSNPGTVQYIAGRGAAGWSTRAITPPYQAGDLNLSAAAPYEAFSADLSSAWLRNENEVPLAPDAPPGGYLNLYRRDNASESYEALITTAPLPGSFAGSSGGTFVGASADGLQSVFVSGEGLRLTPDTPLPRPESSIYDFSAGELHLVSVLPDGAGYRGRSGATTTTIGGSHFPRRGIVAAHNVVSDDGSRIFWTAVTTKLVGTVYVRENPTEEESAHLHGVASGSGDLKAGFTEVTNLATEAGAFQVGQDISGNGIPAGATIAAVAPGSLTLSVAATEDEEGADLSATSKCTEPAKACTLQLTAGDKSRFLTASPDGSKALIETGEDLSVVDVDTQATTPVAGEMPQHFLEAGDRLVGDGVLGAGEDLSRIYFISREDLAAGATAGQRNLYLDQEGSKTFIATLSAFDAGEASEFFYPNPVSSAPRYHDSRVSADGRQVVFTSNRSLTGYDNTDAITGEADLEVFRYDADSGQLSCVSCNPSGARPVGDALRVPYTPTEQHLFESQFEPVEFHAAASLPTEETGIYSENALSKDGNRVFFESFDALVPEDTNGAQDVYQWEAQGSGDCHKAGGCVSLISTGTSPANSQFVDAPPGGGDVFFRTSSSIDPRDPGSVDIYDARVDGGFAVPASPPPCEGDTCQSPPSVPEDATPASAGFRGPGNPALSPRKPRRSCRAHKAAKGKGHARKKQAKRCKRAQRRAGR